MRDYYSHIASGYNELHREEQRRKLGLIKGALKVRKSWRLLDVGCGTGLSSGFGCKVIGIDPSAEMLKRNPFPNVLGYAENLPFKDKSFDCVVCVSAVHNFNDYAKGLREIERVGKNKYVITVLKKSKKYKAILKSIERLFKVDKKLEDKIDTILVCSKKV